MSRKWNGESLVDELSALLGDTSTAYKARVTGWLNDVIFDVHSRHDWGHAFVKGKKILSTGEEIQSLEVAAPEACVIELASGGSLTVGTDVSVLITYLQDNGVESVEGEESNVVTITDANKTISLSDIPTSQESLVTKRNVYVKIDDGAYYFHSQIADNISTTLSISTLPDSLIEPPDYASIRRIQGSPFFEGSPSNRLKYKSLDQLRLLVEGSWSSGSPEFFSPLSENSISVYPTPSSELEVSFNYYRSPFKLYYAKTSQPDLPVFYKPLIKAGVIALGYEYRDREGWQGKLAVYESMILDTINRKGRVANVEYQIRDVHGNFDGMEIS